tara:strand:+ start:499 stop:639 length:141 start_codon:yes stop_codon:yes gene_type:complete
MLEKKMLNVLKKLPYPLNGKGWKAFLYLVLIICWATILGGTFFLFY